MIVTINRNPMPIPTLRTDRLVLRPFVPDDAPTVQRLAGEYEVASTTLTMPHPYKDGMAESWIENHEAAWEADAELILAITTEADGVVGAVGLTLVPEHQRGEVGYWVGVPYWNRGYATEAAEAVLILGFDILGLNRIQAEHFTGNPASGKVMQKLGMKFEGVLRQHFVRMGDLQDVAVYSLLSSERPS